MQPVIHSALFQHLYEIAIRSTVFGVDVLKFHHEAH